MNGPPLSIDCRLGRSFNHVIEAESLNGSPFRWRYLRDRSGYPMSTWLGPLPDGKLMVIQQGREGLGFRVIRLQADGTTDPTFEWPLADLDHLLLTLPDGSLLVGRWEDSVVTTRGTLTIMKIKPDGVRDLGWTAHLESTVPGMNGPPATLSFLVPTQVVSQADGSLLGIMDAARAWRGGGVDPNLSTQRGWEC